MKMKKVVEQPEQLDTARQLVFDSFQSPESSLIAEAHYNHQTRQLEVTLRPSSVRDHEKTYLYEGVVAQDWIDFMASTSKGQFFGARIRSMYPAKRKV